MIKWIWAIVGSAVALIVAAALGLIVSTAYGQGACSNKFDEGETITLTATPIPGHVFVSWEGGPCDGSTDSVCTFVMPAHDVDIKAKFKPLPKPPRNLRITKRGS